MPTARYVLGTCTFDYSSAKMRLSRAERRQLRRTWKRLLVQPLLITVALGVGGCGTSPAASAAPASAGSVVVLISGTENEPRPIITTKANDALAAQSDAATGPKGQITSAQVVAVDGGMRMIDPLTPLRPDGQIENGLHRKSIETSNLQQIARDVQTVHATKPGLDLLDGLSRATGGVVRGTLIVISNGLATASGLDLRVAGWDANPDDIVKQLRERDLLPDFRGWRVIWTGLNATAGNQPALPKPVRDKNLAYWSAICQAAGASSCEFDTTDLPTTPSDATVDEPVVPVPTIQPIHGPQGPGISVPDTLLGFAGNSAVLPDPGSETIEHLAATVNAQVVGRPDALVTVTGYTADPPESHAADRHELSLARAQAVADALHLAGVLNPIEIDGGGAAPRTSCIQDGICVESLAQAMRRVEVTVSP